MIKGEKRVQLAGRLIQLVVEFPEVANELDKFIESLYREEIKPTIVMNYGVLLDEFHLALTSKVKAVSQYRRRIGIESISSKGAKAIIEESLNQNYPLGHYEASCLLQNMFEANQL